jgi:hypothetical protein
MSEQTGRGKRQRAVIILSIVGALFALFVVGVLLRNSIASFVAARVLASQNVSCNRVQVSIPAALPLSAIESAPMRCESSKGPVRVIDFRSPLVIELKGFGARAAHCSNVTIDLRPRRHPEVDTNVLGDIADLLGLDEPGVELLFDAAETSSQKSRPFSAARATLFRAGQLIAKLSDVHVNPTPNGMVITARKLNFSQIALLGDASLRVVSSPDRVLADVRFSPNLHAKVIGENMRARRPKIKFEIGADTAH